MKYPNNTGNTAFLWDNDYLQIGKISLSERIAVLRGYSRLWFPKKVKIFGQVILKYTTVIEFCIPLATFAWTFCIMNDQSARTMKISKKRVKSTEFSQYRN